MFQKVLIANRGAIACRIIRTLRRLGIQSVAIYSEADAGSLHVTAADEAVCVGPAAAADSYLNMPRIVEAALQTNAQAIHPGYGFLSENAAFAESCETSGIVFLGPTPQQISSFGLKNTAREIAVACGAPVAPGTGLLPNLDQALRSADAIGYPVMLKSAGGGGGIGMKRCNSASDLREAYESVKRLSESHFKSSGIFLEKFVSQARHIEVQIFGDGNGGVVAIGERDCSVQRRNQKVVEEAPAPHLSESVRTRLHQTAVGIMRSVQYRSAGTVEFLYDAETEDFYFLEVNSRLQVEHGVTEEVFGIDLVEWMVRLGDGSIGPLSEQRLQASGSSIQVRVYAEDPLSDFRPSSGRIVYFEAPDCRVETWIEAGTEVTPFYDPLLAKLIVRGKDRTDAVRKLQQSLSRTRLYGVENNLAYLAAIAANEHFQAGGVTTNFLAGLQFRPPVVQVMEPGVLSIVQQYPGRIGYWAVGVPPSGPMDSLSFRIGNRLLDNDENACGLELTLSGPTLRFPAAVEIAITGADMCPTLNGKAVPMWTPIPVPAESVLKLGAIAGPGARTYISFKGGLDVPNYLGSGTTFTLGNFGGATGRQLRTGDSLPIHTPQPPADKRVSTSISARPEIVSNWDIGVLYGPHGAPDFFTDGDIDTLFATEWRVHHNSSRTGVRLIGPKPTWARADGGDAGLHPSNIHDNAYAVGAIDFTGDMPVILGPDGPSLGGFVCPAVIVEAELWKVGQLKSGDTVRFHRLTASQAETMQLGVLESLAKLGTALPSLPASVRAESPIAKRHSETVLSRVSGDRYLLVEFGDAALDLTLRLRAHALMTAIEAKHIEGITDLTPGIRSLQIHYASSLLSRDKVLSIVDEAVANAPNLDDFSVPSRIVHLPLSWDDPATRLAIERYMGSVRPDAPWCPSNLEFIRRVNGLDSIDDVYRIVFDANYLVLGLGDVYLGAPVATPIDPRHRLVTTKYNPARTWTPENAVGIGGAYLCVYGMEGPGGYQFVGRTVQMWNTFRTTEEFEPGKPWLLRFFDQIRFFPVSAQELLDLRRDFPLGRTHLRITPSEFRARDYHTFLDSIAGEASEFRARQQAAFAEERERWAEQGEFIEPEAQASAPQSADEAPPGCEVIRAPATASVWRIETQAGKDVEGGQRLLILEAMKMEIAVNTPRAGRVVKLLCQTGAIVSAGQPLIVYEPS